MKFVLPWLDPVTRFPAFLSIKVQPMYLCVLKITNTPENHFYNYTPGSDMVGTLQVSYYKTFTLSKISQAWQCLNMVFLCVN